MLVIDSKWGSKLLEFLEYLMGGVDRYLVKIELSKMYGSYSQIFEHMEL